MYNYQNNVSPAGSPEFPTETKSKCNTNWANQWWQKIADMNKKNGEHRLLTTTNSPTISASTTVTNFESFETLALPLPKYNRRMGTLEENLKMTQLEIEPLKTPEKTDALENIKDNLDKKSEDASVGSLVFSWKLFNQVLTSLSVSLVSMVLGFVAAYTSPAADTLKSDLLISDFELSWIGGLMPLGALVGGLVGGQMIEIFGRKCSIFVTDILLIVSWICIALASNVWFLYVGRTIAGFAVGIASLALPVYLGETIQPEVRGTLGLLPTGLGNIGILISFVVGSYISWNNLAWIGVALPTPFLILAFLIPETPRWYISKNQADKARSALQWLRGKDADILDELNSLIKSQKQNDGSSLNIKELVKRENLKPLLISLGLMLFQQMSGINAVIFYTVTIFEMAGSTVDKSVSTIIVGIVNFVATFIATVLIDKLGRKILLYISGISMAVTLGLLGTYFYLIKINVNVYDYGWLPLASFVTYVLGFSLGFGPIPWLMLGEILPAKVRGSAASVATAFNWTCTFIVTKTFVDIIHQIGPHGTFWMFAIICVLSLAFIILWVPETQGQSLQDIERKLAGRTVRRLSSAANLKPLPTPI